MATIGNNNLNAKLVSQPLSNSTQFPKSVISISLSDFVILGFVGGYGSGEVQPRAPVR